MIMMKEKKNKLNNNSNNINNEDKIKSIKYILVSQGIKIYETFDKDEALRFMNENNKEFYDYKQKCLDQGERFADNKIFMYEEY